MSNTYKLFTPLYEVLRKEVLACYYLHTDETPMRMLDKDKKEKLAEAIIGYITTAGRIF